MKTIAIVGVYIWGALYAAGVFTAGMIWGDRIAVYIVLGSAAAAYVSQFFTTLALDEELPYEARKRCWAAGLAATGVSVLAAAIAGIHLVRWI